MMAKRPFNPESAQRAQMGEKELCAAVNEYLVHNQVVLLEDPKAKLAALSKIFLLVLYERYQQECALDEM